MQLYFLNNKALHPSPNHPLLVSATSFCAFFFELANLEQTNKKSQTNLCCCNCGGWLIVD